MATARASDGSWPQDQRKKGIALTEKSIGEAAHAPFVKRRRAACDRRQFLAAMGLGGLFYTVRGAFAQELVLTPAQTLGPYYPDRIPLDKDNDLLILSDSITPAVGEIAWVGGRVLDRRGQPIRGATVEIWQADNNGAYIHSASPIANRDANFQGYGRFITASTGEYLFRTVKPGLYPGRTRHIHYQVTLPGGERLITQLYVQGESLNNSDGILNGIRDASQRSSVIVPFAQVAGSSIGELAARFDIVLDYTPVENPAPVRPTLVSMSGVVNGATFYPGVPAGSWITLFGNGLASSTRVWGAADIVDGKLPESLDGVNVNVNNQPASVYYVSPTQLNVQAPSGTTSGSVNVTVSHGGGTSDSVSVEIHTFMPGFFQFGSEYIAAVRADGAFLAPAGLIDGVSTIPAQPGDQVMLFGTGFGPASPDVPAGRAVEEAVPLVYPVGIRIDNQTAAVSFAGLTGVGLYQFNVTIPELADGDHAVVAEVGGVRTEKIARIRVERQTTAATPSQVSSPFSQALLLGLIARAGVSAQRPA